jgi:hypothetical protein
MTQPLQEVKKKEWKSPAFVPRNSLQLKNSFFQLLLKSGGIQTARCIPWPSSYIAVLFTESSRIPDASKDLL